MQIKTFEILLGDTSGVEEELNRFLRSHRVLKLERSFCLDGSGYLAFISPKSEAIIPFNSLYLQGS